MKRLLIVIALLASQGAFARDAKEVYAFRKDNACPATGKKGMGACPGWVVDHAIPLCAGGADKPYNMQWQSKAASYTKDTAERALCARLRACTLPKDAK